MSRKIVVKSTKQGGKTTRLNELVQEIKRGAGIKNEEIIFLTGSQLAETKVSKKHKIIVVDDNIDERQVVDCVKLCIENSSKTVLFTLDTDLYVKLPKQTQEIIKHDFEVMEVAVQLP